MNGYDQKPVIIIVHGAWHRASQWFAFALKLQDRGHIVECPQLKTCRGEIPPTTTLEDDISLIRDIALSYLQQGREIIAIMHSYGGIVGTNALSGLGKNDSRDPGMPGYVRGLIYVCAFMPLENASLDSALGTSLPPWIVFGDDGVLRVDNPAHHFYGDLPPEEQDRQARLLTVHLIPAQVEGAKAMQQRAAWRSAPSIYIVCDNDKALLPSIQETMLVRVEQEGAVVKKMRSDSGHSPWLSNPDVILEAVSAI